MPRPRLLRGCRGMQDAAALRAAAWSVRVSPAAPCAAACVRSGAAKVISVEILYTMAECATGAV